MIPDWSVPISIVTPLGTIDCNDPDSANGYFIVRPESQIGPSTRITQDNIPQQDGAIPHSRYYTGVAAKLKIELWVDENDSACADDLQEMWDFASGRIRSLIRAGDNEGRLIWTPAGGDVRMLDDIDLLSYPTLSFPSGDALMEFEVDTPYPYAIDFTQTSPSVNNTTANVTNGGNAEFWPVVQVFGPASNFIVRNNSVLDSNGDALSIEYDSGLPGAVSIGGGDYAEIDMFRGTVYLNGDGANLKPGVDMGMSDLFQMIPGANSITTDVNTTFLMNDAWS